MHCHSSDPNSLALFTLVPLALVPSITLAQARLEREGVVLYWGLVAAAIAVAKHLFCEKSNIELTEVARDEQDLVP